MRKELRLELRNVCVLGVRVHMCVSVSVSVSVCVRARALGKAG